MWNIVRRDLMQQNGNEQCRKKDSLQVIGGLIIREDHLLHDWLYPWSLTKHHRRVWWGPKYKILYQDPSLRGRMRKGIKRGQSSKTRWIFSWLSYVCLILLLPLDKQVKRDREVTSITIVMWFFIPSSSITIKASKHWLSPYFSFLSLFTHRVQIQYKPSGWINIFPLTVTS